MTQESKIPDNQKIKDRNSALGNYVIAIISAGIYVLASHPNSLDDMLFFSGSALGALLLPAIISGLISAFGKKRFSKVFAWTTVIFCVLGYLGNSMN